MNVVEKIETGVRSGIISRRCGDLFSGLYHSYISTLSAAQIDLSDHLPLFSIYLDKVLEQIQHPFSFDLYHRKIRVPFDHYRFGIELFKPLVDFHASQLLYPERLQEITHYLDQGENVVWLANHQTEVDPALLHMFLERLCPQHAADIIFVAGERVLIDPIAIPISLGCDLLCIYSKRYIDHPPDRKEEKMRHNQRTMKRMAELLQEGGKWIYVAPSGGRDRMNEQGKIRPAPFDPASVEMFRLMARQAEPRTHFYPLSLKTYHILPPPKTIEIELGEPRIVSYGPVHLAFGAEVDLSMELPGDRHAQRIERTRRVFAQLLDDYDTLPESMA